jgi:hypothetical protein
MPTEYARTALSLREARWNGAVGTVCSDLMRWQPSSIRIVFLLRSIPNAVPGIPNLTYQRKIETEQ